MTKKDYELIARVVRVTVNIWLEALRKWKESDNAKHDPEYKANKIDGINKILASLDVIAQGFCHELKKDNPKFDADKFKTACGLPTIKNNKIY